MKQRVRTGRIRQFIIDSVNDHPHDIARHTAAHFKITPQAVQRHLNELLNAGTLTTTGKTRSKRYSLQRLVDFSDTIKIEAGMQEHVVWENKLKPLLGKSVPTNVMEILSYGFTEMFNNVLDHSGSESAHIECVITASEVSVRIFDFGVGIFKKIMNAMSLPNEVEAIWELAKGKFTTDPQNHTGEGIFFTSRMFDTFSLMSGSLYFSHTQPDSDWLIEDKAEVCRGTLVQMAISLTSKRHAKDVFDEFSNDYSFAKTHMPLSLMQYGQENLVSRSQAKRLINRFEKFKEIILDFRDVEFIGQGFADEVFRVFSQLHPDVQLIPINTNAAVKRMIAHAKPDGPNDSELLRGVTF